MDMLARQQAYAAAAAQAASTAAESAATVAARTSQRAHGTGMQYEETTHVIGEVSIDEQAGDGLIATVPLPGAFGTAVSLVATVSAGSSDPADAFLWFWLSTSLGGERWVGVASPGDTGERLIRPGGWASLRLHGPFADRLAVRFATRASNRQDDRVHYPSTWQDVTVQLGVQRV